MKVGFVLLFLPSCYPVWIAWQANRRTSLCHAVWWMIAAWAAWGGMMVCHMGTRPAFGFDFPRYLALCLTGCAGIAVLGARRPGLAAWNFVVLGLLAVLLLPVAEGLLATGEPLGPVRKLFLGATLAMSILNYLPTRLAPAALLLAVGVASEFSLLLDETATSPTFAMRQTIAWSSVALVPWLGFLGWRVAGQRASPFDRQWLDFRDRFGLLWGQRVREQFNRAAGNVGWPVHLSWQGLRLLPDSGSRGEEPQAAMAATLHALLKRFINTSGHQPEA